MNVQQDFSRNRTSVKDLKASVNNTGFILSHFIILLVPEKKRKTSHSFLATLVALHFTPVSKSVSESVGRVSD